MMELHRTTRTRAATFGQLTLDGAILCVTLEDPDTEGQGPIPTGRYAIVLTYSDRFQALLPELLRVPHRTGIRIHAGNTSADTTGCILVGRYQVGAGEIANSKLALAEILRRYPEWNHGEIEITG